MSEILQFVVEFLKNIFNSTLRKHNQRHFLSYQSDGFYLDGIKIIDKKATIQELIIRYLINSYIENIYITTSKYVSIHQIVKFLQMNGVKSDDYETQIRKAIWRIRSICYRVSQIELIESEAWKGYRIKSSIFIGKL